MSDTKIADGDVVDVRLAARSYRAAGLAPIPLRQRSKQPLHAAWTDEQTDDSTPWPGNIGIRLGAPSCGVVDLDLDCEEARLLAPAIMPATGAIFGRPSAPRSHRLYRCDPTPAATVQWQTPETGMLIEVRSTGGQTMVPPSIHPIGESVYWHEAGDIAAVGEADLMRAANVLAACSLLMARWPEPEKRNRYHAWGALIGALLRCGVAVETVEKVVACFIERHPPGRAASSRRRAAAIMRDRLDRRSGRVPGFRVLAEVFGESVAERVREWLGGDGEGAVATQFSDDALALLFVERHGADLRHVAAWGQWQLWDRGIWARDKTLRVFDLSRAVCRAEAGKKGGGRSIASAHTVAAVVSLARADRLTAGDVEQWDSDAWLLMTKEDGNGH